ncbi:MAG: hypothetical protein JSU96_01120 [Acidobacteriota bacterium]|nr:MAG: hypothetical protein JSU96_01120 [Acidobacteriota bacterium]
MAWQEGKSFGLKGAFLRHTEAWLILEKDAVTTWNAPSILGSRHLGQKTECYPICYLQFVRQVIIRNLDESTVAALKARAAANGKSLAQELRFPALKGSTHAGPA